MEVNQRPWVAVSEVYDHFGYRSQKVALNAINAGNFPVTTFKAGRVRVIHREVYDAYFRQHRDTGLADLQLPQ